MEEGAKKRELVKALEEKSWVWVCLLEKKVVGNESWVLEKSIGPWFLTLMKQVNDFTGSLDRISSNNSSGIDILLY